MRNNIPKALAMTKFGMYMTALKKPENFSFNLASVNQIANNKDAMICGIKPQIQISKVLPKYLNVNTLFSLSNKR